MENFKCIDFTYDSSKFDIFDMKIGSVQVLLDVLNIEAEMFECVHTVYPCTGEAIHSEALFNDVDVYDYALSMLEEIGGDLARLRFFDALGIVSNDCVEAVRDMLIDLRRFYVDFIRASAIWKG